LPSAGGEGGGQVCRGDETVPSLNLTLLVNEMVQAGSSVLSEKWPDIRDNFKGEMEEIGKAILRIQTLLAMGEITQEQARLAIEIQKKSATAVMIGNKLMSRIAVEGAINAALGSVAKTVNTALGWRLFPE
jgi:hypothetical protein